jgi:tRNA-2-methylthio-N6-dimethylallyladenosine synthase
MSGRAPDNRLVHFTPEGTTPRPGDLVTVTITRAAPHYLVADGAPAAVRRTRAGDAWEARLAARSSDQGNSEKVTDGSPDRHPVALGMPALSRPD